MRTASQAGVHAAPVQTGLTVVARVAHTGGAVQSQAGVHDAPVHTGLTIAARVTAHTGGAVRTSIGE